MILHNNNIPRKNKYIFSNSLLEEYNNYSNFLDTLDIEAETKEWRLKHIRGFLDELNDKKILITQINEKLVYEYLSSLTNLSSRTREHRANCMRLFLNWLNDEEIISFKGTDILPNIRCNKDEKVISYYSDCEIEKIINSINKKEKNGKRDYAILLLICYLGLRTKDVRNLKLEHIHWEENKIIIVHNKNNEINSFFMPENLRYSLIDYLKNERNNCESEYFFTDDKGAILERHKIYSILNKYMKIANINIENRKHGPHALRHSLATSLINNNHSIYEISNVLGHQNINDTKVYIKVDLKQLKKLSLEVIKWQI